MSDSTTDTDRYGADRSNPLEYLAAAGDAGEWTPPRPGQTIPPLVADSILTADQPQVREVCHYIQHSHPEYDTRSLTTATMDGVHTGLRTITGRDRWELGATAALMSSFRHDVFRTAIDGDQGYDGELTIEYVDPDALQTVLSFAPPEWRDTLMDLVTDYHYNDITIDWEEDTIYSITGQREPQVLTSVTDI